jgi:hypothetical protein
MMHATKENVIYHILTRTRYISHPNQEESTKKGKCTSNEFNIRIDLKIIELVHMICKLFMQIFNGNISTNSY